MALIVVAAAASTAKTLSSSTARRIGLRLRLVNLQRATAKLSSIQCCDSFIRFRRIGHLDKGEAPGAAGFTVRNNADTLDCAMRLEQAAKLGFRGAVW